MNISTYRKQFRKFFNINPDEYMDPLYHITGRPSVDIGKLDDYLHTVWGEYDAKGDKSMKDCIMEHYGEGAVKFLLSALSF